ncbi:MAG: uroporphyrinogen decarboxylase family protein [Bacteroidota bacterium]
MSEARFSILALLHRERPSSVPAFSGLVHVLAAGLEREGWAFSDVHTDPGKMARAAAATFRLTGLPSAAIPFDLCVEAEALGAAVDFRDGGRFNFPRLLEASFASLEDLLSFLRAGRLKSGGRVPLVCEAISALKRDIGTEAVIGGILSGPYTVLSMLTGPQSLYADMKRTPETVLEALFELASFVSEAGESYRQAGADFLTVHEMGGSPALLGPRRFEHFVLPALKKLIASLSSPRVLAVCGRVHEVAALLGTAGADALSIDQSNDLRSLRLALPEALLFGNLDPVGLLSGGTPEEIRLAAGRAASDGADAVWPGCDLLPATPAENIRALAS